MPRCALLICGFAVLLSVNASSQQPSCKTLIECQARVHSWEQWSDKNLPKCKAALKDADRLGAENDKLKDENDDLRSSNYSLNHSTMAVSVLAAAVGIGIGVTCAFWLVRGLKRLWPVSYKGKQLVFMVCGAVWITGAAIIAVNDSDLSKHPVNLLFTVLVYSIPGLLFSGIGFWWFGKDKEKAQTATG